MPFLSLFISRTLPLCPSEEFFFLSTNMRNKYTVHLQKWLYFSQVLVEQKKKTFSLDISPDKSCLCVSYFPIQMPHLIDEQIHLAVRHQTPVFHGSHRELWNSHLWLSSFSITRRQAIASASASVQQATFKGEKKKESGNRTPTPSGQNKAHI